MGKYRIASGHILELEKALLAVENGNVGATGVKGDTGTQGATGVTGATGA